VHSFYKGKIREEEEVSRIPNMTFTLDSSQTSQIQTSAAITPSSTPISEPTKTATSTPATPKTMLMEIVYGNKTINAFNALKGWFGKSIKKINMGWYLVVADFVLGERGEIVRVKSPRIYRSEIIIFCIGAPLIYRTYRIFFVDRY
jgi:hypothetical protein